MATTENPHRIEPTTEVDRVVEVLSSVMAKNTIDKWLATPNGAFDGLTPLEVIERGDVDRIWRMVDLLEFGRPWSVVKGGAPPHPGTGPPRISKESLFHRYQRIGVHSPDTKTGFWLKC